MNDLAWRKFPVNTIRNEDLDYISFLLPQGLQAAPYMFYMTAICKCDDDGVFDIEDGMIFSRLMKMGSPVDVMNVASYMEQRKIITRIIPNSSIYMITDWDAPDRRGVVKTKTAEERRAIIARRIETERTQRLQNQPQMQWTASEAWTEPAPQPAAPDFPPPNARPAAMVDFNVMRESVQPSSNAFFCPEFDKNAKCVEQTERERGDIESKENTHTEKTEDKREEREAAIACGPIEGPTAILPEENKTETAELRTDTESGDIPPEAENTITPGNLVEQAIGISEEAKKESASPEEIKALEVIANDFFVRNSLCFNPEADAHAINKLAVRVSRLKTAKNPPEIVMQTILRQFKIRATTKNDYFYGCNITPQFLLTSNTWSHILQQCSALLLTHKENNEEWKFQMTCKNPEEQLAIDNDMKSECLKYGIDPNDPARASKLLLARQAEPKTG